MSELTYIPQKKIDLVADTPVTIEDLCRKSLYVYGTVYPLVTDSLDILISPTSDSLTDWFNVQTLVHTATDHLVLLDDYVFKRVKLVVTAGATFTSACLVIERI
jgi:hypothetical protein